MGIQLGDLRPILDKIITELKRIGRNTDIAGCCAAFNSAGIGISVPAGFRSISIVALSGTVNVTMTDGSTYPMTTTGETLIQVADGSQSLPAYTISGGTWKWIGIK